jgi:hypothetical protein
VAKYHVLDPFIFRHPQSHMEGHCVVEVMQFHENCAVVIVTELPSNSGPKVRDTIESIVSKVSATFGISLKALVCIEHFRSNSYPSRGGDETFHRVEFCDDGGTGHFHSSRRRGMSPLDWTQIRLVPPLIVAHRLEGTRE